MAWVEVCTDTAPPADMSACSSVSVAAYQPPFDPSTLDQSALAAAFFFGFGTVLLFWFVGKAAGLLLDAIKSA